MGLISCSSDSDEKEDNCLLKSIDVSILNRDFTVSKGNISVLPDGSGKIFFTYNEQNKISKISGSIIDNSILGGVFFVYADKDFKGKPFEATVSYIGNTIRVENTYYLLPNGIYNATIEYYFNGNNLTGRKIDYKTYDNKDVVIEYTYQYLKDKIIERIKDKPDYISTLYLQNGNLIKIETMTGNSFQEVYQFSDYDNSKNYLSGKYFIPGAFYNAFSKNNFQKIAYRSVYNSQYTKDPFIKDSDSFFKLDYDSNNIATVFQLDCK